MKFTPVIKKAAGEAALFFHFYNFNMLSQK